MGMEVTSFFLPMAMEREAKKMTLSYGDRSEKPTLSYGGMVNLTPLVMEITPKLPILAGGAPYHLHIASAPPRAFRPSNH